MWSLKDPYTKESLRQALFEIDFVPIRIVRAGPGSFFVAFGKVYEAIACGTAFSFLITMRWRGERLFFLSRLSNIPIGIRLMVYHLPPYGNLGRPLCS